MCIKGALQAGPNAEIRCLLVVLDRLMSLICADGAQSSQFLRAVHKALPRESPGSIQNRAPVHILKLWHRSAAS